MQRIGGLRDRSLPCPRLHRFGDFSRQKKYDAEGLPGLYRHPSSKRALARFDALKKRIVERRAQ